MAETTIAVLIVAAPREAGVPRIDGVAGDSLTGLTTALRADRTIATPCGDPFCPGNLHLLDARGRA